ncbi:MAG: ADOP family duplicated permease [Bryobacteraceae bacterium]
MSHRLNLCLSLYRRLANAYPHEFRMVYGEDLDRLGEDAVPEAWGRYGLFGLVRLLADIALRLPAEYLDEIRQDVTYALRVLAKAPGFTSVAVLSLAVGIGMCSAVLSECRAIVGPAPGLRDPATLATFIWTTVSYPYFERYRDARQTVTAAAAVLGPVPFAVAFPGDKGKQAERVSGHLVSPEYFTTLGVTPAAGRVFGPETEKPGMAPVVVVSDRFWRTRLGSDPHAVGRGLRLNGSMATIVGIGPRNFLGIWPQSPADLFVPVTCGVSLAPELSGEPLHRSDREVFRVVFRLAPGVTLPAAEAALDAMTRNIDQESGARRDRDRKGHVVRLMPAGTVGYATPEQHALVDTFNVVLWALVLSLVCANLAGLLLARGSQRRREIAIRLSVGAGRARLVRQFLTESVLLSLAGGLAGIVLAYGITHVLSSLPLPSQIPLEFNCQLDLHVIAITLAIALAAGVGFGLAPALSSTRADIGVTLKEGAQAPLRGYRRFGLRNLFVVGQMAASLMLLLITWFVALAFLGTARLDTGVEAANLDLVSLDPVRDGFSAERAAALFTDLPDELLRVDGVRDVALTGSAVPSHGDATHLSAPAGDGKVVLASAYRERIGANYFATVGAPLVGGREFDPRDREQDAPGSKGVPATPAILNQTAARTLFGAEDPIGRRIREGEENYTVVGLARDMRAGFLVSKPVATVFLPLTAEWIGKSAARPVTVLVRGTAGRNTMAAVRDHMESLHPDLTVFDVHTMQEDLDRINSFARWTSAMYVILGFFALLLACIGLGGVTAYAVVRRRKEIGIRMALGARASQVQGLVLREGTALVAVGSVLGVSGAFALARVFAAYSDVLARSFGQRENNLILLVGAPLALAGLAMLACYLPARRATRIDPVAALREE